MEKGQYLVPAANNLMRQTQIQTGNIADALEICGCFQGIPANDVGLRTDVMDACPKAEGMMMLIRSMAPEVLAVDEIGREVDIRAMEKTLPLSSRICRTMPGRAS